MSLRTMWDHQGEMASSQLDVILENSDCRETFSLEEIFSKAIGT